MKMLNKLLSIALAFLLVFTSLTIEVFASTGISELRAGQLTLNDQLTLYNEVYYNVSSAGKLAENYMVYSPGTAITPMIAFGNDIYGAASVDRIYEIEEAAGNSIVAMSNGDYFTMATGVSVGMVIKEGIIRTSEHHWYETIGFALDGKAKIGKSNLSVNFLNENTGESFSTMAFNKVLTQSSGAMLYSQDFGDTNEASIATKNVVIEIDTGQAYPNGTIEGEIAYIADATGKFALSENQLVISIAAQSPYSSALATINAMQAGDKVKVEFVVDEAWEDVQNAVGVERRLVTSGTVQSFTDTTRAPRTAIGIKSNGDTVLYTVDGRQSNYSIGMTYAELAARMKELGCVDAVNLDGGGSTMMFATYPGYENKEQVNKSSDSTLRSCGNYILFKNNKTHTTTIKHIHVYPYSQTILAGASLPLEVKATDSNYFYVEAPDSGITYSLNSTSLGSVSSEGIFTAGNKAYTGTISAKYNGITGSTGITVVSSPDSIALVSAESGVELPDEMSISAGDTFALSATAIYKMLSIVSDESSYSWSVSGDIGTIDEKGLFKATTTGIGQGTITASSGNMSDSIAVTIVTEGKLIENFENKDKLSFELGEFENLTATIESALSYVHNGRQSLKLDYSYDNSDVSVASEGAITNDISDIALPLSISFSTKSPTMFSAWIYADGSSNELQLNVSTAEGIEAVTFSTLDFYGWKQVYVQLPEGVTALNDISVITNEGDAGSGIIYIDQIMAGFGYYLDSQPPTIAAEVASGVLIGSITDNFDSEISSDNMKVAYDGGDIDFDYNQENKSLASLLPDGDGLLHRVVIKVVDLSGNIGKLGISVLTEALDDTFEKEQVFSDMSDKHWATQYAEYLYYQNIITGSVSKEKRIYSPDKTMTRQEFAAVVVRWLDIDTENYSDVKLSFNDNSKIQDWAKDSVRAALSLGFMTGKSVTGTNTLNFDPTGPISRQEVMTVIGRVQEKGYAEAEIDFKDTKNIASWALPYVKTLVAQGVISGYNNLLDPSGSVTRGQVAKIIFELN